MSLDESPPTAWWWTLLRQFQELVIWILLGAAAIAAAMGDWADTAAISAIVWSTRSSASCRRSVPSGRSRRCGGWRHRWRGCVRDGEPRSSPPGELVPGDRIELEAGDHVPADARLVEAYGLAVQESALTGESAAR